MRLSIEADPVVQLRRVPASGTSNGKPGRVHVVVFENQVLHDLAQGTKDDGRWPWNHPTERVTNAEWVNDPCKICEAALSGITLPGYV